MTNKEIIAKIITLNKELDLLKDELLKNENIEPPKPLTGWERVEENETCYYIEADQCVGEEIEEDHDVDRRFYDMANYFSTEEKAQEIADKQTLWRKLQRFADEHNGEIENQWHEIYYRPEDDTLAVQTCIVSVYFGAIKFSSVEIAQKAIDTFHDELVEYFTK